MLSEHICPQLVGKTIVTTHFPLIVHPITHKRLLRQNLHRAGLVNRIVNNVNRRLTVEVDRNLCRNCSLLLHLHVELSLMARILPCHRQQHVLRLGAAEGSISDELARPTSSTPSVHENESSLAPASVRTGEVASVTKSLDLWGSPMFVADASCLSSLRILKNMPHSFTVLNVVMSYVPVYFVSRYCVFQ